MYNQSRMYNNIPMQGQIPYCPFMRSMMMRSEDLDDGFDITLPDDIEDDLNEDTREDIDTDTKADNIKDLEDDAKDDTRKNNLKSQIDGNIDDSSIKINYDDNQFRFPAGPDEILRIIERNNPMVIRRLVMYGIPYHAARNIVRRIIYLTLQYHR